MNKSKLKKGFSWFLQIILGLEFILAGQAKFTRPDAWTTQFDRWGYPDNFSYAIGGIELIFAIVLFFPKYAAKAAMVLGVVMIGASVTHAIHGEWDRVIVTLILTVLLALLFILRRPAKL